MTQSILLYERRYHERDGIRFDLEYYLLIDQIILGGTALDVYGVKIQHFREGVLLSQGSYRGITPFGPQIMSLLNRLADSLTLPGGAERMLETPRGLRLRP